MKTNRRDAVYARPQPQLYEPQVEKIGDPVRHHPQQPLVLDRVEGSGHRLPVATIFQRQ
ncbi:hypothetical protein ACVIGB_008620 [Bradyrhizobium sp. USDA 4341]